MTRVAGTFVDDEPLPEDQRREMLDELSQIKSLLKRQKPPVVNLPSPAPSPAPDIHFEPQITVNTARSWDIDVEKYDEFGRLVCTYKFRAIPIQPSTPESHG